MDESVSLNEASELLDVHYMTAYRYVRTGRLAAEKRGGQWFINLEDLRAVKTGRSPASSRSEILPERVEARLLASDENGTFQILEDAMAAGAGPEEIYLELLAPALSNIGQRWRNNELSVSQEHVATTSAVRVISRLGSRFATNRGRARGNIMLASVDGDSHTIPTAMLKDLLRSRGYDVADLGANTPASEIASHAAGLTDLMAIGIAATTPGAEEKTAETVNAIRAALPKIPIVVGGAAFANVEEIEALGDCIASTSARRALEIFDELHEKLQTR